MSYTEKWKVLRCQEMSIDENVKTNQKHLCVRMCVCVHTSVCDLLISNYLLSIDNCCQSYWSASHKDV